MAKIYSQEILDSVKEKLDAKGIEMTKKNIKAVWDSISEVYGEKVAEMDVKDIIVLPAIGSVQKTTRAARTGHNPKTGEQINIAAANTLKLKVGKTTKETL